MQTDIPLKTLTRLRAQDLLPLLGVADAIVRQVIVAELPTSAKPSFGFYNRLLPEGGASQSRSSTALPSTVRSSSARDASAAWVHEPRQPICGSSWPRLSRSSR